MCLVETIRPGQVEDVPAICELINYYAERGKMLHRSLENVYRTLRGFRVADNPQGQIVGCIAVDIFWADLGEIKSLAVDAQYRRQGIGAKLTDAGIEDAKNLGIKKLFVLTYETEFFTRRGFKEIDRSTLPEKVWGECVTCPKVDACDEVAMMLQL